MDSCSGVLLVSHRDRFLVKDLFPFAMETSLWNCFPPTPQQRPRLETQPCEHMASNNR